MDNLVSIIIPAYNAESTLEQTMLSVLEQTYSKLEVIVVDDGSKDATLGVAQSFTDKRVKVVTQKNMGAGAARNAGIKLAAGDLIMFCDADDIMDKNMVKLMTEAVAGERGSLAICGMKIGEKDYLPKVGKKLIYDDKKVRRHVLSSILKDSAMYSPCNKIYWAKLAKKVLFPTDVNYGEDLIFNLRYLREITKIIYIEKPLYHYNLTEHGEAAKGATQRKDRNKMYRELKEYANGTRPVTLRLIKIRWGLSVIKNRLRKHGNVD